MRNCTNRARAGVCRSPGAARAPAAGRGWVALRGRAAGELEGDGVEGCGAGVGVVLAVAVAVGAGVAVVDVRASGERDLHGGPGEVVVACRVPVGCVERGVVGCWEVERAGGFADGIGVQEGAEVREAGEERGDERGEEALPGGEDWVGVVVAGAGPQRCGRGVLVSSQRSGQPAHSGRPGVQRQSAAAGEQLQRVGEDWRRQRANSPLVKEVCDGTVAGRPQMVAAVAKQSRVHDVWPLGIVGLVSGQWRARAAVEKELERV
ncbi:hypothetical protein VTK26DRAFT_957 [Humicola hyalothermophila]